jgi:hypothetical protein
VKREFGDVERCLDHERMCERVVGRVVRRCVAFEELKADFEREREKWRVHNARLSCTLDEMRRK